jgi:tetratricopeptide (TPR) repeat protein
MTRARNTVTSSMIGLTLLLGGCAAGAGEGRPVLAMDGQHLDASDPVERGRALLLTGQYGLAIEGLSEAVTRDPGDAQALSLLAVSYAQVKRFDLADRYHAQALEIDPGSVVVLNNWGYSYLVRGDGSRATDLLARAAAANDGRPIVTANLALARGDNAGTSPSSEVASRSDPMRSVQISSHVILVRPAARLRRMAPGVQMLVTSTPDRAQEPVPVEALVSRQASKPGHIKTAATTDWRLFQALFALMDSDTPPSDGVLVLEPRQLAEASSATPQSPFGFFPDVDDFTKP